MSRKYYKKTYKRNSFTAYKGKHYNNSSSTELTVFALGGIVAAILFAQYRNAIILGIVIVAGAALWAALEYSREKKIKEAYFKASGVDISEQYRIRDDRAKGYIGEFEVFKALSTYVKAPGKILMNVELPMQNGQYTEADCVFLHKTGVYVFECKNWSGHIMGRTNEKNWTIRFKTQRDAHPYNPVKQNEGHIRALRKLMLRDGNGWATIPINSVVLFTNKDCVTRIIPNDDSSFCTVLRMAKLREYIQQNMNKPLSHKWSMNEANIDKLYDLISPFAHQDSEAELVQLQAE